MHGSQIEIASIWSKKKRNGTAMTLLVFFKKSAAASMQSMAVFKELYPQQTEQRNVKARIPPTIITPMAFFWS